MAQRELAYGTSYSFMQFYNIEDDSRMQVANEDWHIAVTTLGTQDAGVILNEATALSGTPLELYISPTTAFNEVIDPNALTVSLLNPEDSWLNGAFNTVRDDQDPLDYGWGKYDPAARKVVGNNIYALKLRSGDFLKIEIVELNGFTYSIRWAGLDGSNLQSLVINKQDHPDVGMVLIDLEEVKIIEPMANFDLLFTRYSTPLPTGPGTFLDYNVTGILSGPGVEVAQANGINPASVKWDDYKDSLDARLDILGSDWKSFQGGANPWVIPDDRAYFVKDTDGDVWKIIFIGFEGSSTGNSAFTVEKVGTISSINQIDGLKAVSVFPNPVVDQMTIRLDATTAFEAQVDLISMDGKMVHSVSYQVPVGGFLDEISMHQFPSGTYSLRITAEDGTTVVPVIKK